MLSKFILPLLFIVGAVAQRLPPGYYRIANAARRGLINIDKPGAPIFLDPLPSPNEIVSLD